MGKGIYGYVILTTAIFFIVKKYNSAATFSILLLVTMVASQPV